VVGNVRNESFVLRIVEKIESSTPWWGLECSGSMFTLWEVRVRSKLRIGEAGGFAV